MSDMNDHFGLTAPQGRQYYCRVCDCGEYDIITNMIMILRKIEKIGR